MVSVLVVDGDPRAASMSAALLRHAGFEVRTALSGEQALEDLRERPADLVVLDFDLPELTGAQVLAAIRQQRQLDSTRVVIYSARAERARFAADGAPDAVVAKAEGPVGLLGAVTRLI